MEYKLIKKDTFRLIGKSEKVLRKDGADLKQIPEFWEKLILSGTIEEMCLSEGNKNIFGAYLDFDHVKKECTYMIGIEKDSNLNYGEFEVREIPEATWAVFTSIGSIPSVIQNTMRKVYEEWFPASSFQHADGPAIEVYLPGDVSANDYKSEIWIPVIQK